MRPPTTSPAGSSPRPVTRSSTCVAAPTSRRVTQDGPSWGTGRIGMLRHWWSSAGTAWSTWGWISSPRRVFPWASWPPAPVTTSPGTSVCPAGMRRPPPASSTRRCPGRAPSWRWTPSMPPAPTALCSPRSVAGPWPWSVPGWTPPSTPAPTPSPGRPAKDVTCAPSPPSSRRWRLTVTGSPPTRAPGRGRRSCWRWPTPVTSAAAWTWRPRPTPPMACWRCCAWIPWAAPTCSSSSAGSSAART